MTHRFTRLVMRFSLDPEAYEDFLKPSRKLPRGFDAPQFPDRLPDWQKALADKDVKAINALIDYEWELEYERQGGGDNWICMTHIGKGWPGG